MDRITNVDIDHLKHYLFRICGKNIQAKRHQDRGTSDQNMNHQFESKIIDLCIARI